jgi:oxidase EvaA
MKAKVRIAESSSDLRCFLEETVTRSEFKLSRINLSEQNHWSIRTGALSHCSNGFFHVAGIRQRTTAEEHLILYQPQSALTGLALFRDGQQVYVLLQARIEPGLSNIGQYGPTIQSTAANYLQMHGGKRTSYAELFRSFSPIANPLGSNIQFDLGKRYFQKSKVHSYLELDEQIDTHENMIWVPLQVIAEVLASDNFLNPDLRSLLSVFDWDLFINGDVSGSRKTKESEDDVFAISAKLLGKSDWKLIALDQLNGWEIQDNGIADVSGSGIWVDMFQVSCFSREVQEWSQPLLSCSNRGLVVLLVRKIDDEYEYLVSFESEFGISGQRTVLPSFVIYPGDNPENISQLFENETPLAEMAQSEEGGRFYNNESIYRVILIEDSSRMNIGSGQRWVKAETLKSILSSSNSASLQLRCIASLILDLINPHSFL